MNTLLYAFYIALTDYALQFRHFRALLLFLSPRARSSSRGVGLMAPTGGFLLFHPTAFYQGESGKRKGESLCTTTPCSARPFTTRIAEVSLSSLIFALSSLTTDPSSLRSLGMTMLLFTLLSLLFGNTRYRDPHGTTTPCYARPFTTRITEVLLSSLATLVTVTRTARLRRTTRDLSLLVLPKSYFHLCSFIFNNRALVASLCRDNAAVFVFNSVKVVIFVY